MRCSTESQRIFGFGIERVAGGGGTSKRPRNVAKKQNPVIVTNRAFPLTIIGKSFLVVHAHNRAERGTTVKQLEG
jgi:hypothetical protein